MSKKNSWLLGQVPSAWRQAKLVWKSPSGRGSCAQRLTRCSRAPSPPALQCHQRDSPAVFGDGQRVKIVAFWTPRAPLQLLISISAAREQLQRTRKPVAGATMCQ